MPLDGAAFSPLDCEQSLFFFRFSKGSPRARNEGVLLDKSRKKRETARSLFHDWTDYNGVAFSIQLLVCGRTFSDFWG